MSGVVQHRLIPMGERKIMPMGNEGLIITIPKIWARFVQLRAGDKVEVCINSNGELHIRPKASPPLRADTSNEEKV